jgi:hypothetical protein
LVIFNTSRSPKTENRSISEASTEPLPSTSDGADLHCACYHLSVMFGSLILCCLLLPLASAEKISYQDETVRGVMAGLVSGRARLSRLDSAGLAQRHQNLQHLSDLARRRHHQFIHAADSTE